MIRTAHLAPATTSSKLGDPSRTAPPSLFFGISSSRLLVFTRAHVLRPRTWHLPPHLRAKRPSAPWKGEFQAHQDHGAIVGSTPPQRHRRDDHAHVSETETQECIPRLTAYTDTSVPSLPASRISWAASLRETTSPIPATRSTRAPLRRHSARSSRPAVRTTTLSPAITEVHRRSTVPTSPPACPM